MCITIIIIIISMICIIIISSSCSSSFPRAEPPLPHVLPSMGTVSRNIFRRPRDQYLPSTSPRTHFAAGEQTVTTCYFEMLFFHPDGAAEKILAHEHRLITRRTNCIFESHQEAGRVSSTSQRQAREGGREQENKHMTAVRRPAYADERDPGKQATVTPHGKILGFPILTRSPKLSQASVDIYVCIYIYIYIL